jgi:hypothetical protein
VIAAVGGGAEAINQKNANNRAQESETQNIIDQQKLEGQASAGARALTSQIAHDNPAQIQGKATGDYVAQLRKNAAGSGTGTGNAKNQFGQSTSSLAPVNANARYIGSVTDAQKQVGDYGNTLADEMGGIDAAVRQRQNEGLGMSTYATGLQGLNQQSFGTNFVNQLRTQAAGQANPWVSLFSGMAAAGGKNYKGKGTSGTPGLVSSKYSGGYSPTDSLDVVSG